MIAHRINDSTEELKLEVLKVQQVFTLELLIMILIIMVLLAVYRNTSRPVRKQNMH